MTLGATLLTSALITLSRPTTWVLALVAFLLRGGLLLVLAPIVALPSTVGIANVVAPTVTDAWLNGPTTEVVTVVGLVTAAWLAWLVLGGWVAAAAEVEAIREVAGDDDLVPAIDVDPATARPAAAVLAVRLLAWCPLVIAMAISAVRLVSVTYRELTVPSAGGSPLIVRVLAAAPEAVVLLLVTWLVGDIVGAIAARRVVLRREGPGRAIVRAAVTAIRHPMRSLVLFSVPTMALILVIVPSVLATALAWATVRMALTEGDGPLTAIIGVVAFVVLWMAFLALLAIASAWRTAAWTVEAAGTFGVGAPVRPGDWNDDVTHATLGDLRPRGVDPDPR